MMPTASAALVTLAASIGGSSPSCAPAEVACAGDPHCQAFGVFNGGYQLHGCATPNALVPNNDWEIFIPVGGNKSNWTPLGQRVNVDEAKCPTHPSHGAGRCQPAPPTAPPPPLPYEALGSVDVGTGESSIFMLNKTLYLLDNIFCGYIDHAGKWNPAFTGHSYVRIREFETGRLVANVTETISTSFVSAFVDHTEAGDVLWLSGLNHDRCAHETGLSERHPDGGCGTGVISVSSTDLVHFNRSLPLPTNQTCNTEVAGVSTSPPALPPHRYVMILECFSFMVNNNADGDLSHGWAPATGAVAPKAPCGGPSIRHEGGFYYVITGGTTVMICRSRDLGATDPWNCTVMVKPTERGGAPGPGDGAIAPFAGFAQDAARKDFPVMEGNLSGWDWNSNDADVCCTGGTSPAYLIWGASTQGQRPHLPAGSPSCTNAVGRANTTLQGLLEAFFA